MTRYLMSVYYPAGSTPPSPDELTRITAEVDRVHSELQNAGAWVFGGGLHHPSTATVVHARGGDVLTTDGPFAETREVLGGFSVIDVSDLDEALAWGEKLSRATTCPIEVRPFHDDEDD